VGICDVYTHVYVYTCVYKNIYMFSCIWVCVSVCFYFRVVSVWVCVCGLCLCISALLDTGAVFTLIGGVD